MKISTFSKWMGEAGSSDINDVMTMWERKFIGTVVNRIN